MIFSENNMIVTVLAPDADRWTANPATDVVNMANYGHACFFISVGAGAVGQTVVTAEECNTLAGGDATAIAFSYRIATTPGVFGALTAATTSGFTTSANADADYVVEIDASELSSDHQYLRLQTTEGDSTPVDAAIICVLSKPRFAEDVLISGIV
jgi:hypothetical protein